MTTANPRQIVSGLKATVRYRVRSKLDMKVLDLAEGGCLLESQGWGAKPDERVLVRLPGLAEVAGKVAWIEEQRAGVAFDEPLYGPVVERFFE